MIAGAKVHLIGCLTTEGAVWELGVMGVDVETDQASDGLWAVQGFEIIGRNVRLSACLAERRGSTYSMNLVVSRI